MHAVRFAVVGFLLVITPCFTAGTANAAHPELAGKTVPSDQDKNGRTDHWEIYDARGVKVQVNSDTNGDGKPDFWKHPIVALRILRERDTNFDGRVDQRMETDFIYDNILKFNRHLPVWRESDDDFDGVIDVYRVRGKKVPIPDHRGQKIDATPWSQAKEAALVKAQSEAAASKSVEKTQVDQMNAKQSMAR